MFVRFIIPKPVHESLLLSLAPAIIAFDSIGDLVGQNRPCAMGKTRFGIQAKKQIRQNFSYLLPIVKAILFVREEAWSHKCILIAV